VTNRITDISIDGCTLQTTGFPNGAFIELVLKPTVKEETINVETAMVCSVRPLSMGIRFLEIPSEHCRRLGGCGRTICGTVEIQWPARLGQQKNAAGGLFQHPARSGRPWALRRSRP